MPGDDAYLLDRSANRRFPLRGITVVVGRGAEAQMQIEDGLLSRRHFALTRSPEGWVIRDLGSTNGTAVNGEKLRTGQSRLLRAGDCIRAGHNEWTLHRTISTPRAAPPPAPAPVAPAAERAPAAPQAAATIPRWQWAASVFLALGAVVGAAAVFLPWVRVDARLVADQLPGGELLPGVIDALKQWLGVETPVPGLDQPISFPIRGSDIHAELLLLPIALIAALLLLDLTLKLGRSSLPGLGYLAIVIFPAAMLFAEWRASMSELGRPMLFGVSLLDLLQSVSQGGASFVDIRLVALGGVYLAVAAGLLLLVGGFARLVMPLARSSR